MRFYWLLVIFSCLYAKSTPKDPAQKIKVNDKLNSENPTSKSTSIPNTDPENTHKQKYKTLELEFYSDVQCRACQKMHHIIEQLKEVLSKKNIGLNMVYKPIVTKNESVNSAFIAANAIEQNKIEEFLEKAYPDDYNKIDDINLELIAAELGIGVHKTEILKNFIKRNQEVIKEKSNNVAPFVIIKKDENHDISVSGCTSVDCILKILKENNIIK